MQVVHLPLVPSAGKLNNVHKNVQKRYKILKPRLLNVLSQRDKYCDGEIGILCTLQSVLGSRGIVVK